MGRHRTWGRLLALALATALLPAGSCDDSNSSGTGASAGGGVATPLQWTNTSGVAGSGPGGWTPLLWNDPNTAPITGGGGGLNRTYEDANYYVGTPQGQNYICFTTAQNPTTSADETTLEGYVAAYYSSLIQAGGAGGFGGIGGIGAVGIVIFPPTYVTPTLRPVTRAWCRNVADPNMGAAPAADPGLAVRLMECQINWATAADAYTGGVGMTVGQAWSGALQGAGQAMVNSTTSQGWVSGGSWQGPAENWFGLTYVETPVGQTP